MSDLNVFIRRLEEDFRELSDYEFLNWVSCYVFREVHVFCESFVCFFSLTDDLLAYRAVEEWV